MFRKAIATKIEPDRAFYPAENYHQDFLTRNPTHPYIVISDLPKTLAGNNRLVKSTLRSFDIAHFAHIETSDTQAVEGCTSS